MSNEASRLSAANASEGTSLPVIVVDHVEGSALDVPLMSVPRERGDEFIILEELGFVSEIVRHGAHHAQ